MQTVSEKSHASVRAVTTGPRVHFFGYYDKFPWDLSGRNLLGLETTFMDRPPGPDDVAIVGMADLEEDNRWQPLAETRAWNWQQGAMLRWLPTAPDRLIIYNDCEEGRFISVILDVHTGKRRTLPMPVYTVSRDGKSAMTLNFARVHRTRPGYGYTGPSDPYEEQLCPDGDGIYRMDLITGAHRLIVSLAQIVGIRHDPSMDGAEHWFNHLLFNKDDTRFLFLHRRRRPEGGWWTRLFTANPDGSELFCVADHGMVSHFDWRNPHQILAWARQRGIGDRYFLFTDRTDEDEVIGEEVLTCDGHCSYSPDGRWILTDTYPDGERMRTLLVYCPEENRRVDLGRFHSSELFEGEIRCDLHPRWSRDGRQVCFDSIHEGARQIYVMDVAEILGET